MNNDRSFDPNKFYLGEICKHGHDYQGTGLSLRRTKQKHCYACARQYEIANVDARRKSSLAYYYANKEACNTRNRAAHLANKEKRKEQQKAYRLANDATIKRREKAHRIANADRLSKKARENYAARIEARRATARASYAANREVFRLRNKAIRGKRKAQKKLLIAEHITVQALKQIFERFGNECAYCGSAERLSVDHFLPLHLGGTHVESNLVPACMSCNSRKNKVDPFIWYKRQKFFSQKRWKSLLKLLGKTQKNYAQIPLL